MDLEILSLTAIWNRVEFKNPLFNKSQVSLSLALVQSKEVDQKNSWPQKLRCTNQLTAKSSKTINTNCLQESLHTTKATDLYCWNYGNFPLVMKCIEISGQLDQIFFLIHQSCIIVFRRGICTQQREKKYEGQLHEVPADKLKEQYNGPHYRSLNH